jgi:hypothetical protein
MAYTPVKGECPILHGAVEAYGLTDRQVYNWCDKGCCPDCGEMLTDKFKKREGQAIESHI